MDDFEDFALTNEMLEKVLGGANMNGNKYIQLSDGLWVYIPDGNND